MTDEELFEVVAAQEWSLTGAVSAAQELASRLRDANAEIARLREIAEEFASQEQGYGPFPGGDPRLFKPDEEYCTPEEIAAWQAACDEWDAGTGTDRGPGCQTMGDGSVHSGTGFGVGVYQFGKARLAYLLDRRPV